VLITHGIGVIILIILREIDEGQPVIFSISSPLNHILVVKGYTLDGGIVVNDPFGNLMKNAYSPSFDGESAIYYPSSSGRIVPFYYLTQNN